MPSASSAVPSAAARGDESQPLAAGAAPNVLLGRYELGGLLGRGASAKVYRARDLVTGRDVAIKSFPNPRAGGRECEGSAAIEREAAILARLRHRHVVRLHEILGTRKKVHFVLDLAAGGELFSLVDSDGRMSEDLARHYFRQLVSAVRYCHSRGVYHRDIKPENLLLDGEGELKVADFGLGAVADGSLHHTLCGTPAYVAPEILSKQGYHPAKVDVWSCGVVLFVLAAGYLPFNDASLINMYRKIYAGRFRCPNWFSPALRHLLRRILDPNPATRIDTDGIMEHPWFCHGAGGDGELEKLMCGHEEEAWFKTEFKEDMARDMTAFDILAFSPGSDLSGLFGPGPGTERVFVGEPAAAVLARVEDAGKKQGHRVRREGKNLAGPVYVEAEVGGIVAKVTVFRVADAVSVVEVVKGHGAEAAAFWSDWLEPAVKPQAV